MELIIHFDMQNKERVSRKLIQAISANRRNVHAL